MWLFIQRYVRLRDLLLSHVKITQPCMRLSTHNCVSNVGNVPKDLGWYLLSFVGISTIIHECSMSLETHILCLSRICPVKIRLREKLAYWGMRIYQAFTTIAIEEGYNTG